MKRLQIFKKNIILVSFLVLPFFGCGLGEDPKLEFSFYISRTDGVQPSYQMAIWLEKPNGEFVKTLFVCDYLSYGGYSASGVCPIWVSKSQWGSRPEEEVDAITQATPDIGNTVITVDCPLKEVPYGKYKYFMEIHITEDYNELYSGDIEIKKDDNSVVSNVTVTYQPQKYKEITDLLSNIKVRYNNN